MGLITSMKLPNTVNQNYLFLSLLLDFLIHGALLNASVPFNFIYSDKATT